MPEEIKPSRKRFWILTSCLTASIVLFLLAFSGFALRVIVAAFSFGYLVDAKLDDSIIALAIGGGGFLALFFFLSKILKK